MSDGPDDHGFDILSLHSELAVNPQPTYRMLQEGSPVLSVDGVGVIVSFTRSCRRDPPRPRDVLVEHGRDRLEERAGR